MDNSREKILQAAVEIFAEKGRHGARMEEIASRAKINKAMLYYFFNTKDFLYQEVLALIVTQTFHFLSEELKTGMATVSDPVEKLKLIIRKHFEVFSRNLNQTKVMTEAFAHDPQVLCKAMELMKAQQPPGEMAKPMCPSKILDFFNAGIKDKVFRKIDVHQLFISIMAMTFICFIGRPMAIMMDFKPTDENKFLKERMESVIDLVLNGILTKRSDHTCVK